MVNIKKMWSVRGYIGLLILLLVAINLVRGSVVSSYQGRALIDNMKTEYMPINHPPTDELIDYKEFPTGDDPAILSTYKSGLSYDKIRKYYEAELQVHGWSFVGEKKLRDVFGNDLGQTDITFEKGNYVLDLYYANQGKGNTGWTYKLYLHMGRNVQ